MDHNPSIPDAGILIAVSESHLHLRGADLIINGIFVFVYFFLNP